VRHFLITLVVVITVFINLNGQPKEEVRAVWLTTVFGLDWPKTYGASSQQAEMRSFLDLLKSANFNTIYLQVRARGDVLYPSTFEPWAKSLTQTLGGNPGYDPLQFTITEAHKRGMEVHAWWNVYKVYGEGTPPNTNPQHIVLKRPDLCKLYNNEWWMDPGKPDTRTYLLNLAMEMVRKYDLDGIHFDFIRYPNPDFDDAATYAQYGGGINKSDWRRGNINQFVYALYDSVQAVRPNVKVGSAPVGIYKDLSTCNSGWDGYTQIFQDSRRWLIGKKHDYLAPQIYWDINTCPRFDTLAMDWINSAYGRHIYPGIAIYRMGSGDGNWPPTEVLAQVDSARKFNGHGQSFYRAQSFKDNQKNITNLIKTGQYLYPANIPAMLWKDNVKPNPPLNVTISTADSINFRVSWSKPLAATDGDTAFYFNVYRDETPSIDYSDIKKVVKFGVINDTTALIIFANKPTKNYYFAVTAYDRMRNESEPSNLASIIVVGVEDEMHELVYALEQNYPNPFNPETEIKFSLKERSFVTLKVYDALGREVSELINEVTESGSYAVKFSGLGLPSGIYFYQLRAGEYSAVKKMVLLK